jgi:hypothetical protein
VQPDREPVQPPSRHQEDQLAQRPPWGIQARCVYRKITTRSRRDGAEASGVCGSGCGGRQHSARSRKILSCFQRHRYEASGGVFCPSSASHTSPPPLNFTVAPRNAGRIVAPISRSRGGGGRGIRTFSPLTTNSSLSRKAMPLKGERKVS